MFHSGLERIPTPHERMFQSIRMNTILRDGAVHELHSSISNENVHSTIQNGEGNRYEQTVTSTTSSGHSTLEISPREKRRATHADLHVLNYALLSNNKAQGDN